MAYTESTAYWTEWRIRHTGLDGVISVLYSGPDHDELAGQSPAERRMYPPEEYDLKRTKHNYLSRDVVKPNPEILKSIIEQNRGIAERTVYVGDNLFKDIAMAQDVGVYDVYAKYGDVHKSLEYELLKEVTHWTEEQVAKEKMIAATNAVTPSYSLDNSFSELQEYFHFVGREGNDDV